MSTAWTIVLSIVGGGSALAFLQFLITRHDRKKEEEKKEQNGEVLKEIKAVRKEVGEFKEATGKRFDAMDRKIDDGQAIQARARLLRFNDEVQLGRKFSDGAWAQTKRDIFDYEAHCKLYPDFPNGEAVSAIINLRKVHEELLERQRNGEKVFL